MLIPAPTNWNSEIYAKVQCNNLKPYIYRPLPQIKHKNMPKNINNSAYDSSPNLMKEYTVDDDTGFSYQNFNNINVYQNYQPSYFSSS